MAAFYLRFLQAMADSTPEGHPGQAALLNACSQMKSTNRYVKEAMEESLNRVSVLQFQRKLADNPDVKKTLRVH